MESQWAASQPPQCSSLNRSDTLCPSLIIQCISLLLTCTLRIHCYCVDYVVRNSNTTAWSLGRSKEWDIRWTDCEQPNKFIMCIHVYVCEFTAAVTFSMIYLHSFTRQMLLSKETEWGGIQLEHGVVKRAESDSAARLNSHQFNKLKKEKKKVWRRKRAVTKFTSWNKCWSAEMLHRKNIVTKQLITKLGTNNFIRVKDYLVCIGGHGIVSCEVYYVILTFILFGRCFYPKQWRVEKCNPST